MANHLPPSDNSILDGWVAIFFLYEFSVMLHEMDDDLSVFHRPLTELFSGSRRRLVTEHDQDFFGANGYVYGMRLLDDTQMEVLREELEVMMQPRFASDLRFYEYNSNESADPSRRLFHALGAWRVSTAFHDIIFDPSFIGAATLLLGGPIRLWHDQVFVKPALDGAVVAWHQDYSYWTRTKPVGHLTCWIGLDDSTVENGCVHYVPGSHHWGLLPRTDLAGDMDAVLSVLTAEQRDAFKPVPIELKAGEVSFHHPMMLHGSYENRSDRPRRAVVINVLLDGIESDTNDTLLDGVPVISRGEKIEGRFFPLLTETA